MKTAEGRTSGFWATGEKGTMQVILFLLILGAILTTNGPFYMLFASLILFMGVAILIDYSYRTAHLTKKQIVASVALAAMFGVISTIAPHILAYFVEHCTLPLLLKL